MASYKVSGLVAQGTASADDLLYLVDTEDGGSTYASKSITVGNFLNGYATESFVSTQLDALVNGAPAALDTLKELSDALGADSNFSTTITNLINANEVHVDNMATLTGVAKDDTDLGTFTGSTIGDSLDIKAALQALETSLETKGSATLLNATTSDKNDLVTLSGVSAGSGNLGSFTGSIISDDVTIKSALQELETEVARVETEITTQIDAVDLSGIATNAGNITQLQTDLAAEVTARGNADTAETTARTNADTALSNRLDTLEADPTTQSLLNAEATTRAAADTALSNRLDTLEADPTTQTLLDAETTARASADNALSGRLDTLEADPTTATALSTAITGEATTRASADTALSGRLDTLEADPTTQTLLTAEATARASSDAGLANRLVVLEADPTTATALSSEAGTRATADTALSNRLDTLEADPTTQTLLDAETTARQAADALKLDLAGGTMTGAIQMGAAAGGSVYQPNAVYYGTAGVVGGFVPAGVFATDHFANANRFVSRCNDNGLSFQPITINSTLRVFVEAESGDLLLNKTDASGFSGPNNPAAWRDITLPSTPFTLTDLGIHNGDAGHSFAISAIEVDGVVVDTTYTVGATTATTIGVDGTATFAGLVSASAVPSDDAHLVNKLYADNLVAGVDLSGIATNAAAIAALSNGAPELLNTITELADALGDDENFATTITGQISTEATTRGNADTALSGRLDTLEADPTTQSLLNAEATSRTSADNALSGRLSILEADPTTQTLLNNEATVRTNNDNALSGRLDTLEADPTTATAVTSAIATETTARQAADALLLPLAGGTISGNLSVGTGILFDGASSTAHINGIVESSAVPTANSHLVNKLYADNLVAGVDLSGIATNAAAISAETTARTSADSALSGRLDTLEADPTTQTLLTAEATSRTSADSALSGRLDVLEADPTTQTLLDAEATARANAITALTNGAVAQNTAAIAAEVNTDRDAAITAAINALTNGAVAQNAADILQEISDRQTAVAAETSARQTAVASLQASITTTNANVANNAQAITTEETARIAADAGKVDKASSVNVHMVGETSAASAPVDAQGADNFLFLVVDKATGAIKSIEKSFLEAE